MAPTPQNSSPISLLTLRRQASAIGAACGNAARADLCGERWATGVPTATEPLDYERAVVVDAEGQRKRTRPLSGIRKPATIQRLLLNRVYIMTLGCGRCWKRRKTATRSARVHRRTTPNQK